MAFVVYILTVTLLACSTVAGAQSDLSALVGERQTRK